MKTPKKKYPDFARELKELLAKYNARLDIRSRGFLMHGDSPESGITDVSVVFDKLGTSERHRLVVTQNYSSIEITRFDILTKSE